MNFQDQQTVIHFFFFRKFRFQAVVAGSLSISCVFHLRLVYSTQCTLSFWIVFEFSIFALIWLMIFLLVLAYEEVCSEARRAWRFGIVWGRWNPFPVFYFRFWHLSFVFNFCFWASSTSWSHREWQIHQRFLSSVNDNALTFSSISLDSPMLPLREVR